LALLAVYVLFALLRPETFARPENLVTMARQTVVVGIASAGMTLIIISGGIDLSVGSLVALTTVVIARALNAGAGPVAACVIGVSVAATAGLIVGSIIGLLRITPFVVTLGAMTILRGAAKGVANEQKIDANARGLDSLLGVLPDDRRWLLFPPGVWMLVLVAFLAAALLRYSRFGRHLVAVGSNERTARLSGVPVEWVKVAVYTFAAALAGCYSEFSTCSIRF